MHNYKKFLSLGILFLAFNFMLVGIPSKVLAIDDITTVSMHGFTQPVITDGGATNIESFNYLNDPTNLLNYSATNMTWAPNDNPIQGSQIYVATVTLTSKTGYEFPVLGIPQGANLNISDGIGVVTSDGIINGPGEGNTLTFDVTFPATAVATSLALTSPIDTNNSLTGGGVTKDVSVYVVNGTTSVIITGTMSGNQTATIGGADVADVTLDATTPLAPTYTVDTTDISTTAIGASKTFSIFIHDAGFNDVEYRVTVTVAPVPTLSNIVVNPSNGVIDLGFLSNVFSYNVGVPNIVTSVTITPTEVYQEQMYFGHTKTITVNGNTVVSESTSDTIPLVVGLNTIPVVITAQKDGKNYTSTYSINITRSAPAVINNGGGGEGGCLLPLVWSMQTGSCQMPVVAPVVPTVTTTPIVPLDVVRQGEGIETVLTRQIIRNTQLATMYGYKKGTNLQSFAWSLADILARDFGYVNSKGKEVRVKKPDVAAYELQLNGTELTIYEYYNSKIVNIKNMSSTLRNKYYYEYYFSKK